MWNLVVVLLVLVRPAIGAGALAPSELEEIPTVFTETAKSVAIHDSLVYPARIQSQINASLVADADAEVAKVLAPLGKSVRRGERILALRHIDPIYDYKPLFVTSPVAGVVSGIEVTEGTRVVKGQRLATITDPKRVYVYAEISSLDLSVVVPGLEGELHANGTPRVFPVRVAGISPQIDPATGTATCQLTLLNSGVLPGGQLGRVIFKVRKRVGFKVPEYALIYRDDRTFIRIVDGDRARLVPVTTGSAQRGLVEITTGLKEGMQIVLRSNVFVAEGEKVKVQKATSAKFE